MNGFGMSVRGGRLGEGWCNRCARLLEMPVRDRTVRRFDLKRSRASAQSCGCTGGGCLVIVESYVTRRNKTNRTRNSRSYSYRTDSWSPSVP